MGSERVCGQAYDASKDGAAQRQRQTRTPNTPAYAYSCRACTALSCLYTRIQEAIDDPVGDKLGLLKDVMSKLLCTNMKDRNNIQAGDEHPYILWNPKLLERVAEWYVLRHSHIRAHSRTFAHSHILDTFLAHS